mgnify:FL=1
MSKTLCQAQQEIYCFIDEAEKCLEFECGYSAMMTVFSVILAVSEAILGKSSKNKRYSEEVLINNFVEKMSDKAWFIANGASPRDDETIKRQLYEIRNGLSHQLSLPNDIFLIGTAADLGEKTVVNVAYILSVEGFLRSVRRTIEDLANRVEYSSRSMDPNFGCFQLSNPRGLGSRKELSNVKGMATSCSASVDVIVAEVRPSCPDENFPV